MIDKEKESEKKADVSFFGFLTTTEILDVELQSSVTVW
jgi:hypothetical protein